MQRKIKPFFRHGERSFFQRSIGMDQPFFHSNPVQRKLTIGQPNDKYEKEADAMADQVVQRLTMPEVLTKKETTVQAKPLASAITPLVQAKCAHCEREEKLQQKEDDEMVQESPLEIQRKPIFESNAAIPPDDEYILQRKCAECEQEEKLQKKSDSIDSLTESPSVEGSLASSKGSGSYIPTTTLKRMENSFGADFSNVRLHTDSRAIQMNNDLHAQAFTHGSDIYFNEGKFNVSSKEGSRLLAHELTHVVQQNSLLRKRVQKSDAVGPSPKSLPTIDPSTIPTSWTKANLPLSNGKDVFIYRGVANDAAAKVASGVLAETDAAAGGVVSRLVDAAHDAVFNYYERPPVLVGPKAGGVVRIRVPSSLWDELVKTNNISERSYPGFSRALNSSEIRINSVEAIRLINGLTKDIIPPDSYYDYRPGAVRPSTPKPTPEAPVVTVPRELPPTEFKVQAEFRVLNNSKIPGSNHTVIEIEAVLGEGLDALNKTATNNNAAAIPKRMLIRIVLSPEGTLIASESATGEANPLVQFLAKRAIETAPKTTGVSPWVKGIGWAGLILFVGLTYYRYQKASDDQKPKVLAQAAGGFAGGMVGGYIVCNLVLGIETLGWSLLICGFLAGIPGAIAGEAIADVVYDEATIDDDEIREWASKSSLDQIRILPFLEKVKMIFSLMKGWVSEDDIIAIEKICLSINSRSEIDAIGEIVEPQLINLSSIGQRTRVRVALVRRIQRKAINDQSSDIFKKESDVMDSRHIEGDKEKTLTNRTQKYETNSFKESNKSFLAPGPGKQQSSRQIQLKLDDKHDLTATSLSGDPILEKTFDNEAIVGKFSNSKGSHVRKIQEALLQLGITLSDFGADEKFGSETEKGVKEFQQKANMSPTEWDGIVGRKTIGLLDRSLRNNRISSDTDLAEDDFAVKDEKKDEACKGKETDQTCPDPNADVNTAADEAIKMIDKVLTEQLPPVKNENADYPVIFDRIFRNNDTRELSLKVAEVKAIFEQVKDFVGKLKTDKKLTRCGTDCDGGCRSGSPAYHTPTKEGGHVITFCPGFGKDKERVLIVIHESHHAAIPGSSDKAYAETRLFDKLDHTKALLNAASFHVYAAWVDTPGSQPIGQEIKDTNLINDNTQKENVNMSLAFLQQWFRLVPFDTSQTVQGAQEAREKGRYTKNNPRVFMELVFSKWFGLTKPPGVPTAEDIKKLRAIDERVSTMDKAFKVPFVILETKDQSFWTEGPGSDIALNANVLTLDSEHMIISLLQELVHATPNISAETEPLYVGTVNDMRNLRGLDP